MTPEFTTFKKIVRGYDPEAVEQAWAELEDHLSHTIATNKELRLHLNSLEKQNTEWGNQLNAYIKIEADLREALLSSQRLANQIMEEAGLHAQAILTKVHTEQTTLAEKNQLYTDEKIKALEQEIIDKQSSIEALKQDIQTLSQQKQEIYSAVLSALGRLENLRAASIKEGSSL